MNNYSTNHPAVRYYNEHGTTPTNRNTYIRRRRGTALMALFTISFFCTMFGGWRWTGNTLGVVGFCALPMLLGFMFLSAVELIETPTEKGKQQ